jgi:hypothetical protein
VDEGDGDPSGAGIVLASAGTTTEGGGVKSLVPITPARKFRMLLHINPKRQRGKRTGSLAGASGWYMTFFAAGVIFPLPDNFPLLGGCEMMQKVGFLGFPPNPGIGLESCRGFV